MHARRAFLLKIFCLSVATTSLTRENFAGTAAPSVTETHTSDRLRNGRVTYTDTMTLGANDVASCRQNKTLRFEVDELTVAYSHTGNFGRAEQKSADDGSLSRFVCWFNLTTSADKVVKIHFTEQTCSEENFLSLYIQKNENTSFRESRTGCEHLRSPLLVEYLSSVNFAVFGIVVQNFSVPYIIRLHITAVKSEEKGELQLQYPSPNIGKGNCENSFLCTNKYPWYLNTVSTVFNSIWGERKKKKKKGERNSFKNREIGSA